MRRAPKEGGGRRAAEDLDIVQLWVRDEDHDDIQALVQALLMNDATAHRLRREIEGVLAKADASSFGSRLSSCWGASVRH
jgi:hypothetical protein